MPGQGLEDGRELEVPAPALGSPGVGVTPVGPEQAGHPDRRPVVGRAVGPGGEGARRGRMASRSGRPTIAPTPRSTVLPRDRSILQAHRRAPVASRCADTGTGSSRPPPTTSVAAAIVLRLQLRHDLLDRRSIVVFHAPPQGVREHPLDQVADEQLALRLDQDRLQGHRPGELLAGGQLARGVDRLLLDLVAPAAQDVEVLEPEAERVEPGVARGALGLLAVLLEPLAEGQAVADPVVGRQRLDHRRRWRRGRAQQLLEHPLAAQHRAGPPRVRGQGQHRRHAEHAAAAAVLQLDAAELGAGHPVDAVVLRQRLVEVRVVGIEQLEDRPILAEDGVEEGDGLLDHRVAQLGRVLGEEPLVGLGQVGQAADAEPLAGEVLGHRPRLRVGEHPPDLERRAPRARGAARRRRGPTARSSGIDDQRKYESRQASSWSETR